MLQIDLINKVKKKKKGFTLVEVVVVLVIIAILIAIAVPSVMKYIDDANEIKDDVKVSYLNKATEGYRVHLYADGKLKDDIFADCNSEKEMQQVLIDSEWIDETQTALADDNNYFHWNRETQRWEKKGSSSGGSGENPDEGDKDPVQEAIDGIMPLGTLPEQMAAAKVNVDTLPVYNGDMNMTLKMFFKDSDGNIYRSCYNGRMFNNEVTWHASPVKNSYSPYFGYLPGDIVEYPAGSNEYFMLTAKHEDYSYLSIFTIIQKQGFTIAVEKKNGVWVKKAT